jgi:hypothetical protein
LGMVTVSAAVGRFCRTAWREAARDLADLHG